MPDTMTDAMTDTIAVWDRLAAFWDTRLNEGNAFQTTLIMPATDRLLEEALGGLAGRRVLDCCCGNGNYARRLAARGAAVTAFDGSAVFVDLAKARTPPGATIDYVVADATNPNALAAVGGPGSFDAAVCSMALMDLADVAPLLAAVRRLLRPGGAFVFSVAHPCFNTPATRLTAELVTENGRARQRFGVATEAYLTPRESPSEGMLNQPEPHPMFHRPLGVLLAACFAAGFVVDAVEEPAFPEGTPAKSAFSWAKRPEIPPALVVRLRVWSPLPVWPGEEQAARAPSAAARDTLSRCSDHGRSRPGGGTFNPSTTAPPTWPSG